ncbi:MAG: metallophosphoesterase [Polyangiaceae bacterium]|nr:metallophosphoesterase [Polyangiaceae bacterium]
MSRTIFVGDVHGCAAELDGLLDLVGFDTGDALVLVGDLIARGPDSLGVLEIVRRTGAHFVLGNHEAKLLLKRANPEIILGRTHSELFQSLRDADWSLLETAPTMLDFPDHLVRVVHAGVVPGVPWEAQQREHLLHLRTVTVSNSICYASPREVALPSNGTLNTLWGEQYKGPPHVVFGHNAIQGLQFHPWATGLDTGCVYGGRLTALVLDQGQRIPQSPILREKLLVSKAASRVYFSP